MTPAQLGKARHRLGLSASGLADILGLGRDGGRTVRRWQSGERRITKRTEMQIRALLVDAGYDVEWLDAPEEETP